VILAGEIDRRDDVAARHARGKDEHES
jgi:hypothetical protein